MGSHIKNIKRKTILAHPCMKNKWTFPDLVDYMLISSLGIIKTPTCGCNFFSFCGISLLSHK